MHPALRSDLIDLDLYAANSFPQVTPIGLNLGFAWTSQEAESAPLSSQMRPGTNQPAALIFQVRQLDLEAALPRLARLPNISRMSPIRSSTLACHARSRFRCCTGESEQSIMTNEISFPSICERNSSTLPVPMNMLT